MTRGYQNNAMRTADVVRELVTHRASEGRGLPERDFESALAAVPNGYSEGRYNGRRYGVTARKSHDGKRVSLFARALAGDDVVSFNLYRLSSGEGALRPCEMPAAKVIAFVLGYVPAARVVSGAHVDELRVADDHEQW